MSTHKKTREAIEQAIQHINPTAPPVQIAEGLKVVATNHKLNDKQARDLIFGFFSHFELDIYGPPALVILRSGYQIRAEDDFQKAVEHLKNAVVGESTTHFMASKTGQWDQLWQEIAAEVEHIALNTHEISVRAILGQLLLESAYEQWSKLVNDLFPFLKIQGRPPTDIPGFLRVAKSKLVLALGKDTDDGLKRLRTIRKIIEARGYQCQLIKDLPEHSEMGLIGKVLFAALSARFVVIENSAPSGHLYELPFVRMAECVVAIMQLRGQGATWMTEDMISKHPLLKKFEYENATLESRMEDAISWAETRIAHNVKVNTGAWPWASEVPKGDGR